MHHDTPPFSPFLKLLATLNQGETILEGKDFFTWASTNRLFGGGVFRNFCKYYVAFGV